MHQSWKTEYGNHLFGGSLDQMQKIKNEHINRSFFKYRSFDTEKRWINWIEGMIFSNSPSRFNDPFDCLVNIATETNKKRLIEASKKFVSQRIKLSKLDIRRLELSDNPIEAIRTIFEYHGITLGRNDAYEASLKELMDNRIDQSIREIFRMSCFSETNQSILMWSHYANNHQGFCIEYDFSSDNNIIDRLYPVFYSDRKFILLPQHYKSKTRPTWPVSAILCKAKEWAYEHEWRYINEIIFNSTEPSCETIPSSIFVPNTIKAVYLGVDAMRYNDVSVQKLKNMLNGRDVKLFEMKFDDKEYKFIPNILC